MQHLTPETLARLADEPPDAAERRHLDECARCRAELSAFRGQADALGRLPDRTAPPAIWNAVRARVGEERATVAGSTRFGAGTWRRPLLQVAAALVLFVGGGIAGAAATGGFAPGGQVASGDELQAQSASREERLRLAESEYLAALTEYAAGTDPGKSSDPAARLAALEGIVLTTRAALDQAPADPLINGYHLAALGERNAMLRQISIIPQEWF